MSSDSSFGIVSLVIKQFSASVPSPILLPSSFPSSFAFDPTDRHMSVSSVDSAASSPPASPPTRSSFLVLNEIVIDRGLSAFISNVDLYLNGRLITRVQVHGGGQC